MSTNNKYRITYILGAIAILLLINSCSTKKNTWTRRVYHNLTSHYNVYWNGLMSLQEGEKSFKDIFEDDYSKVLPVYNYGDKKLAQRLNPKMDRAIKKASIGIQKHSMYFGGKEQVKWIDDCYMLMGKAHFYKHDYISARRVFDYVAKTYQDNPIHYEAYLWLAKTHLQNERYEKAIASINLLQSKIDEEDFPYYVEKQIPLVLANFYIEQEKYEDAFPYLERSLELNNDKEITTRVKFILGQLYQREGNLEKATEYFTKVVKKNPDYVMAFEAKMHLAETYASENGGSKEINKILNKMLKEARNKEFKDQIYYALAEVAKKDGNDTLAIKYLRNSVMYSETNQVQRTKSSLEVADMFFERSNYTYAEAYYDTAVSSLTKDYPDYEAISQKASVLTDLVTQAQIIKEQDSLQYLVSLDTSDLYAIIDKKIEAYKLEQEKKQEEEDMAEGGTQFVDMNDRGRSGNNLGNGQWYFYNTAAVSSGYNEFKRKWGNRKLEDNWRLSNKKLLIQGDEIVNNDSPTATDSTSSISNANPIDRSYYLSGLPNTPEKIQASNEQLIEAYNKLGFIYLMKLNDSVRALETYLDFQKRFPENQYRLESWYALYKIYKLENNEKETEFYKNLILGNYPESTYAKVIINPDYYTLLEEEKLKASELYMRTYDAFKTEKFYRVISYSNKGIELYPDDTALIPKFLYLKALSLGKVDTPDTLYSSLDTLIVSYPNSSVVPRAKALLKKLQLEYGIGTSGDVQNDSLDEGNNPVKSIYNLNSNDLHFVMLVVDNGKVEINPLKIRLSDFNSKYFSLRNLKVKSLLLNNEQTIITVGNFKNKDEALNYFNAINMDKYVLSGVNEKNYYIYPISTTNYPLFYRDKNIETYKEFFEKNYLAK